MKTLLYNPIFINPQAYYVFPRLTRYLQPDNESTSEPANYIGTIEVKVIAYGDTTLKRTYTNTDSIDLSEFKNTWIRISLFTKVGSCVLGEWKIGNMESDLPYIDPEVLASLKAVVIVGNKTNNDSDRAIVKNLVDASNPFVISNAAFKLNSGFGKYEVDFTSWIQTNGVIASSDKVQNSIIGRFLYFNTVNKKEDVPSFKVNITLGQQGKLQYNYIKEDGTSTHIVYSESGIYTIPASYFSKYTGGNAWFGFYQIEGTSIIEQIPSFEGAFVTDGVNDLITSAKTVQEMGITDKITVVSMIHKISSDNNWTNLIGELKGDHTFVANRGINTDKTGIYGYTYNYNENAIVINNILGDKNNYTVVTSTSLGLDNKYYVTGFRSVGIIQNISQIAWYWTFIANRVLTTDEINQVIAYYNLDRTLRPDILCNITKQGITNDNHADFNDKLIDYSGNGRDIQMNNLAWKGGSGIAAKPFETIKDYTIVSDEARQKLTIYNEFSYKVKSNTPNHYWTVQSIIKDNTSYQVTIITDKDCYWINSTSFTNNEGNKESIRKEYPVKANTPTQVTICGLNEFEYPEDIEPTTAVSYVNLSYAGEITVTFIPSCKGGLLLDGINDFGKVTGMPIYKDYTVVTDREIFANIGAISSKNNPGAFVETAGNSVYSFGQATSGLKFISTRSISYLSKYSYCGQSITAGAAKDGTDMWLGTIQDNDSRFFNGAIYSLMSFPYSMSEFLIERQLKKHKLGTLYPDMVEFRPVIKANNDYEIVYTAIIKPDNWQEISIGDYVTVGKSVAIQIKLNNPLEVTNVSSNSLADISFYKEENSDNIYTIYGRVLDGKSPQKITIDIQVDSSLVQWNPVVESTAEYSGIGYLNYSHNLATINVGDYISIGDIVAIRVILDNTVDEIVNCKVNGQECEIVNVSPRVFDCKFTLTSESPQNINITIDEYIRYEDIVQPYPVLLRFNDENGNEVSWGGKFKVGSNITRIGSIADPESNLLNGLYSISGLSLNGKAVTSSTSIVEKQMVFKTTATWLLDNNEPKVILSPSRLRIPNSSYKLLGYIPDISGHGNHGKINNSAYAEGSGVNEDGSYQFDGVDDFVTIPTLSSGGKQVLMKVNLPRLNEIIYDQRKETNTYTFAIITIPSQIAYDQRNSERITYIDGILNTNIIAEQLMGVTHNIVVINSKANLDNTRSPILGRDINGNNWSRMRIYDFMLFESISTDDKIKELNEYVGIEGNTEWRKTE